jgi:hypothetical protein
MLINVDLPAPFSPSKHKTSPGIAARLMRSLATTPGKVFVISMSSTAGVAVRGVDRSSVAGPVVPNAVRP